MMNRTTGQRIDDLREHIEQSIADIVLTPIGSRIMRREYGSLLPQLIDQPDGGSTLLRLYAAIASALLRWEPRFKLTRVQVQRFADAPGRVHLTLLGAMQSSSQASAAPLSVQKLEIVL